VGGVTEAIEDGVHGRLVPPGDVDALAAALAAFHHKTDEVRRMGLHAAERALERYTWGRVVEDFEAVYDEVLGLASFSPQEPPARKPAREGATVARGESR
jgi:glycosyltransferase involved in cell wall biosynthesis